MPPITAPVFVLISPNRLRRARGCVESRAPKSGGNTLAIHYSAAHEQIACGRTGANLSSTQDKTQVSCKLCQRSLEKGVTEPVRKTPSLAELRAAAKAAKAAQALVKEVKPTLSPRAAWQQRLQQLPGKNRLPRGIAQQGFI